MRHKRVYHLPAKVKLPFDIGTAESRKDFYGYKVREGFFHFPEIVLDIIENEPSYFKHAIRNTMTACRGAQFSCGTILTKDSDADVPFLFTPSELKRYHVINVYREKFGDEPSVASFTVMKLAPRTSLPERRETLDFLIGLVLEEEERKKHLLEQSVSDTFKKHKGWG